jgi:hypothetical protein
MTHIEQLHLDCLKSPQVEGELIRAEPDIALKELAAITENREYSLNNTFMNNEYVIINKTELLKRIEELEKSLHIIMNGMKKQERSMIEIKTFGVT